MSSSNSISSPWAGVHRRDIDGLRAIAVLSVVLFHVNPAWLPGGFAGVDVFFTISGYLITGLVVRDLDAGQFSFRTFYERRVRRILPALWVVLAVGVLVSWRLMLPSDAIPMAKSALWSTFAAANLYFGLEVPTDYFQPASSQLPFLHLWSLGIEEQYYLIWPVLLVLIWRATVGSRHAIAARWALAVVVLATVIGELALRKGWTNFAYFMLPARAGELALGAALALGVGRKFALNLSESRFSALVLGAWALLLSSMVFLDEHLPFPGVLSLWPTLGAAVLLACGERAVVDGNTLGAKLCAPLSSGCLGAIGRASYSIYLWHWPVLAWWRYLMGQPDTLAGLGLLALTLLLGFASQRWVEDPARRQNCTGWRLLGLYLLLPMLVIATMVVVIVRSESWGWSIYPSALQTQWRAMAQDTTPAHRIPWVCQQHQLNPAILTDPKCEFGAERAPVVGLVLGDSLAAHMVPMLRAVARDQGVRLRSVALGACAPLTGSLKGVVAAPRLEACQEGMSHILVRATEFPLLIIGADWAAYSGRDPQFWARFEAQLQDLSVQGRQIWLLPKMASFAEFDALCWEKRAWVGDWLVCPPRVARQSGDEALNQRLALIASRVSGVQVMPLHRAWCDDTKTCAVVDETGRQLYADHAHIGQHGAEYLADILSRQHRMPKLLQPIHAIGTQE